MSSPELELEYIDVLTVNDFVLWIVGLLPLIAIVVALRRIFGESCRSDALKSLHKKWSQLGSLNFDIFFCFFKITWKRLSVCVCDRIRGVVPEINTLPSAGGAITIFWALEPRV
jgi:hypothetical protein